MMANTRFPLFEEALAGAREAAMDRAGIPLEHHEDLTRDNTPDLPASAGDEDLPLGVEESLSRLETRASTLEMNAERLEDADNLAGAQHAREEAMRVRAEFDTLAQAHGFDPHEDPEEGWAR